MITTWNLNYEKPTGPNPEPTTHGVTNTPANTPLQVFSALPHVIYVIICGESYDNYGIDYALQHGDLQI